MNLKRYLKRYYILLVLVVSTAIISIVFFDWCSNYKRNSRIKDWNKENSLIVYSRVPKTGSSTFTNIFSGLSHFNDFSVLCFTSLRDPTNVFILSLLQQTNFVRNITRHMLQKRTIFQAHLAFINFNRFGHRNPTYISLIRDPMEQFVSYYYYIRYGGGINLRNGSYMGVLVESGYRNETIDQCVSRSGAGCSPSLFWLQIPFFCGQHFECWIPGSNWALNEAKRNFRDHYLLVGITEELQNFVIILEALLPRFFKGSTDYYLSGNHSHVRKTKNKLYPSKETVATLKRSNEWKMENEFYQFAYAHFRYVKSQVFQKSYNKTQNVNENILPVFRNGEIKFNEYKKIV